MGVLGRLCGRVDRRRVVNRFASGSNFLSGLPVQYRLAPQAAMPENFVVRPLSNPTGAPNTPVIRILRTAWR